MNPHVQEADHLCLETGCGGREMQWEALLWGQGYSFWRKWAGLYSTLVTTLHMYVLHMYVLHMYVCINLLQNATLKYVGFIER